MSTPITRAIVDLLTPHCRNLSVTDIRIGLIYTSVRLSNGLIGIAWTGQNDSCRCMQPGIAGSLSGQPLSSLLQLLTNHDNAIYRSVGLATANALSTMLPWPPTVTDNVINQIHIQPNEKVTMVGYFGPMLTRIRQTGCQLDIIEMKTDIPDTLPVSAGPASLAACDVALITATSVVTHTLDELLAHIQSARAVVILGPSTFMCPQVYAGTPVTHLAGSVAIDAPSIERVVSEGGGTKSLKPYLRFETLIC